jgi:hypothetical protein
LLDITALFSIEPHLRKSEKKEHAHALKFGLPLITPKAPHHQSQPPIAKREQKER